MALMKFLCILFINNYVTNLIAMFLERTKIQKGQTDRQAKGQTDRQIRSLGDADLDYICIYVLYRIGEVSLGTVQTP